MALRISIVTPDRDALAVECEEAVVPGVEGELGLLPQHVPLVSALAPGVLTTVQGGKKAYYVVGTGFAEIDEDLITILTNTCEAAKDVDLARAKKSLADATAKLDQLGPEDPGYAKAQMRAKRAAALDEGAARVR